MKNRTRILATVFILALLMCTLVGIGAVSASAQEPIEAKWGENSESLTSEGTLAEAFSAASSDTTVGYIQLQSDVDLAGDEYLMVEGGSFTLDLNGNTVSGNSNGFIYLWDSVDITIDDTAGGGVIQSTVNDGITLSMNDTSNASITVKGGTIIGKVDLASSGNNTEASLIVSGGSIINNYGSAIFAGGASVKITDGTVSGTTYEITWKNGTIDLSECTNIKGIRFINNRDYEVDLSSGDLLVPSGYSIYDEHGEFASAIEAWTTYAVDVTSYKVIVNEVTNGAVTLSPEGTRYAPGTTVYLDITPDDGYIIDRIELTGAILDTSNNSFTVESSDVTVDISFKRLEASWGTEENLEYSGTLEEAFAAAASDSDVSYIRLIYDVDLGTRSFSIEGGSFTLDLNGNEITSNTHVLSIRNSTDITVTDTSEGGLIETTGNGCAAIILGDDSEVKITVAGGTVKSEKHVAIYLWDIMSEYVNASLTVEGGTVIGNNAISTVNAKSITIKGGTLIGNSYAISSDTPLTITGGKFESNSYHIIWHGGKLDLSGWQDPSVIRITNYTGNVVDLTSGDILIPEGYSLYSSSGEVLTTLSNFESATLNLLKLKVTLNCSSGGTISTNLPDSMVFPGTEVLLTVTPEDGYRAVITVDGATLNRDGKGFTVENSDVNVNVEFKLYQADWGSDVENLSYFGTLEEAFWDALSDSSIKYIKLVDNIDLAGSLPVVGGEFTLDLNGYYIIADNYAIEISAYDGLSFTIIDSGNGGLIEAVQYDAILITTANNVKLTVAGGTIRGGECAIYVSCGSEDTEPLGLDITVTGGTLAGGEYAVYAGGESLTVTGGTLVGDTADINWRFGTLDLSLYANIAGTTVVNNARAEDSLIIPEGYVFYDSEDNKIDSIPAGETGSIDSVKYKFEYSDNDIWSNVEVDVTPGEELIAPGTTVTVAVDMSKSFSVDYALVSDGEVEISFDEETSTYSFVMPERDVKVEFTFKHNAFVFGTSEDELTEKGDFSDFVAAINAGTAAYARLTDDYELEFFGESYVITGKATIDVTGNDFKVSGFGEYGIVLGEGADITFFADTEVNNIYFNYEVEAQFVVEKGAKLSFTGAAADSLVFLDGGAIDISCAHLYSEITLYNITESKIKISDYVTLGSRFRAIDWENYEHGMSSLPALTELEVWGGVSYGTEVEAVFKVSFDLGEGSGTVEPYEVTAFSYDAFRFDAEGVYHPDGLPLIGWSGKLGEYDIDAVNGAYHHLSLDDVTLTAVWGAPVWIGGVGMFDGDYLPSGSTKTTKNRPVTGGYAYYKDGVLTLCNFSIESVGYPILVVEDDYYSEIEYAVIYATENLVIELVGNNKLSTRNVDSNNVYSFANGIFTSGTVTFRGSGTLRLECNNDAFTGYNYVFESGTVTSVSDDAFNAKSLTVDGGVLITLSDYGIWYSDRVHVVSGELHLLPLVNENNAVGLITESLTVEGGLILLKGESGICSDYVTVSGGKIIIDGCADTGISSDAARDSAFNMSGGEITISNAYTGISFSGDITISGGSLNIDAYIGITAYSMTISGGSNYITAYVEGIRTYNLAITGGDLGIYSDAAIVTNDGAFDTKSISITGGSVEILGGVYATELTAITLDGKTTEIYINGVISSENAPTLGEDIRLIIDVDGILYYEGVEIPHAFSDFYYCTGTHHFRTCSHEGCAINYFNFPVSYYQYFEGSDYAEHVIGEDGCICGYGKTPAEPEEIPENTVITVGDKHLKIGDYLTFDGRIVTEKPDGGYFYVTESSEAGVMEITMNDFTLEYVGDRAFVLNPNYTWVIELLGESTLTVSRVNGLSGENYGIYAVGTMCGIIGDGTLTINADYGIGIEDASVIIAEGATINVNANMDGIVLVSSGMLNVNNATLNINADDDGIQADCVSILFGTGSDVTITAGDDGIDCSDAEFIINYNKQLTVIVDDEGFNLDYADLEIFKGRVTVFAGDDAIDVSCADIYLCDSTVDLTADDRAITVSDECCECSFYIDEVTLNVNAGDDGIHVIGYGEFIVIDSILNIAAKDEGLALVYTSAFFGTESSGAMYSATPSVGSGCVINIDSDRNYLEDAGLYITDSELSIKTMESAFVLDYAEVYVYDTDARMVSKDVAITSEDESVFVIGDSTLYIEAPRYGVVGDMEFVILGSMTDLTIQSNEAVNCVGIHLDESVNYLMNVYCDGEVFLDEKGEIAGYVTVRGYEVVEAEMNEAIEVLNQLIAENGEIEKIAGSISDVNALLGTLTNIEGEGRIDLIEDANVAISKALVSVEEKLAKAEKDIADAESANAAADAELAENLAALDKALADAESEKAAADEALAEKLAALEKALADANSANDAANAEIDSLKAELDNKSDASGWQPATTVIAIIALVGCAVLVAAVVIIERKNNVLIPAIKSIFAKKADNE